MAIRIQAPLAPAIHGNSPLGNQLINAIYHASIDAAHKATIKQILSSPTAHQISSVDLGNALALSIQYFKDEYYDSILELPLAQSIPANGQGSIGHALVLACRLKDPDILEALKNHPMFLHISPNGQWGLGEALEAYLNAFIEERPSADDPDPRYLQAIIFHVQAAQINYTQPRAELIGKALMYLACQSEEVFRSEDSLIVNLLLSQTIAHLVNPNGPFGLGRILANAAYATTPIIINNILDHPLSRSITSLPTIPDNKITNAEKAWSLNKFGFTEAIFLAVENGDPEVRDALTLQRQIVQNLISFANANNIPLNPNGPFGLAESLTAAANISGDLVSIILSSQYSLTINPNAPDQNSGGLNNALLNAIEKGNLSAVQSILTHPNARLIQSRDLTEAINLAANLPEIAQAITRFIQLHQIVLQ